MIALLKDFCLLLEEKTGCFVHLIFDSYVRLFSKQVFLLLVTNGGMNFTPTIRILHSTSVLCTEGSGRRVAWCLPSSGTITANKYINYSAFKVYFRKQ